MNGAAALPDSSSSRPNSTITASSGSSHHFLLWRRNSQYSPRKPPCASPTALVKSSSALPLIVRLLGSELPGVAPQVGGGRPGRPVGVAGRDGAAGERVAVRQPEQAGQRGEQAVEQYAEQDVRRRPGDGKDQHHPADEDRP